MGNKEAYAEIYENHFDDLFDYGEKIIDNADLIEDAIHDLFTDLWKSKENLGEPKSLKGYLLSAIRRVIFRKIKKERRYTYPTDGAYFDEYLLENSCEEKLISKQMKAAHHESLKQALKELTSRQKEAIYLRFYHNLDGAEVASVMNISLEAVYNHISKGIGRLKDTLRDPANPPQIPG